jgi:hypothetical protein
MECRTSVTCGKPETPGQAASWLTRMNKYLELGLCHGCAAQAAYGHQNGFAPHEHVRGGHMVIESIQPPCKACALVVAGFPVPAAGGWRKHPAAMREFGGRRDNDHAGEPGGTPEYPGSLSA